MSARFFHPESMIWRVDREMALLLGGGRALLMQLAHPKVAAGVADHSRFRQDPLARLIQTMDTMWSIVFDEVPRAQASLDRLRRIHRSVQGGVKQGDLLPAGTSYTAQDPELLLWVHATLIDSALVAYERFVEPLSPQKKREYYNDTKRLAMLLDVPPANIPPCLEAFEDYMREMIESEAISVSSTARGLAEDILHPRPLVLKLGGPLSAFITVGLLAPKLREAYGLKWDKRREKALKFLSGAIRTVVPFVPPVFRVVPHARAAELGGRPLFAKKAIHAERGHR